MGKRKSSKPPPKKQRPKLDVAFNCPFCNSSKSVTATLDYDAEVTIRSALCFTDTISYTAGAWQPASVPCPEKTGFGSLSLSLVLKV